jgi:2-C-methyl-D-erythritol 2,4-cyclodiphosphate synthase
VTDPGVLSRLRIGFGYDIHRFAIGPTLKLGGVSIQHSHGLESHSDGDAVCHALMDALLGACGLPDIGVAFPNSDPSLRGADSYLLLLQLVDALRRNGLEQVLSVQVTILAEHPRISPHAAAIREHLATALKIAPGQVGISAGTNEKFDAVGRGEALVAFAHLLLLAQPGMAFDGWAASVTATSEGGTGQRPGRQPDALSGRSAEQRDLAAMMSSSDAFKEDYLPERVKKFEHAVNTKLPPLPKAPKPEPGDSVILYTDGGSRGNPGPAATGWVIFDEQGRIVHEVGNFMGDYTNNEAEYNALEEALTWIEKHLGHNIKLTVRMDSELIIKQLKGEYQVKAANLRPTYLLLLNKLAEFHQLKLEHVPRAQNARADALVNQALDKATRK